MDTESSSPALRRFHARQLRRAQRSVPPSSSSSSANRRPPPRDATLTAGSALDRQERERQQRIDANKQHTAAVLAARASVRERERKVVMLRNYQSDLDRQAASYTLKAKWQDELTLDTMLKAIEREQKIDAIDARKQALRDERERQRQAAVRREAKVHYLRDQMQMLEEQLLEGRKCDEIADRALREREERDRRDAKANLVHRIDSIRERLAAAASDAAAAPTKFRSRPAWR
ncbi:hypothetical protein BC828DRAFT_383763 [Blastocladiella britannica]|nr:hypothetical protein BC828DRAFT_383763 [Blastocladiella britannica]